MEMVISNCSLLLVKFTVKIYIMLKIQNICTHKARIKKPIFYQAFSPCKSVIYVVLCKTMILCVWLDF